MGTAILDRGSLQLATNRHRTGGWSQLPHVGHVYTHSCICVCVYHIPATAPGARYASPPAHPPWGRCTVAMHTQVKGCRDVLQVQVLSCPRRNQRFLVPASGGPKQGGGAEPGGLSPRPAAVLPQLSAQGECLPPSPTSVSPVTGVTRGSHTCYHPPAPMNHSPKVFQATPHRAESPHPAAQMPLDSEENVGSRSHGPTRDPGAPEGVKMG